MINTNNSNVIIPNFDPGVTSSTVYDLGAITGNLIVQESVGGNDQGDAYSFSVSQAGEYTFSLEGLNADVDLYILDAQGNQIDLSATDGIVDESITLDLAQGNYVIFVDPWDGNLTQYTLNISDGSAGTGISGVDPGDTPDTAANLGVFTGSDRIFEAGSIGGEDAVDLFKFSISSTQEFDAVLENLNGNADLYVLGENMQVLADSINSGTASESISGTIAAGDYFLGVVSYDGVETNYDLSITTDGGNTSGFSPVADSTLAVVSEDSHFVQQKPNLSSLIPLL